ncbi:unnamed protein product [Ambrosiozyma monospora]|uniref:Unnamed protein product n=1 Tax=Ambrosiozyma monospora TaxID=43982 RepID=A0ACB5TCR0_AMBMO|nr:unnamed protein product [Ambrosiozyma monospora]
MVLHQSSLVLFILSAMTHIAQPIRNDSLRFLNILLDSGSEELVDSIIRANWAKLLRNFMQLLDWPVDATKGTTSSSFSVTTGNASLENVKTVKNFQERKLTKLKTLIKIINAGCPFEKEDKDTLEEHHEENLNTHVQIHSLTMTYMISKKTDPFDNLKLFKVPVNLNLGNAKGKSKTKESNPLINVEGLPSEDVSSRRKILVEIFSDGLVKGLSDLQNDDSGELRNLVQKLLDGLTVIRSDYQEDLQN